MNPEGSPKKKPFGIWFTSSYSGARGECVEVAYVPTVFGEISSNTYDDHHTKTTNAAIRDSKHRKLGMLEFSSFEWQAFLKVVKSRGF